MRLQKDDMPNPTDDQITRLVPTLERRSRATTRSSTEDFRPQRPGIVERVAASRHQLVVGRRGVGKTMLLWRVIEYTEDQGNTAIFIDLEHMRDIPYPDVLLRLLGRVLNAFRRRLPRRNLGLRRRIKRQARSLDRLLREPQSFVHSVVERDSSRRRTGADADLRLRSVAGKAGARHEIERIGEQAEIRSSEFERTKISQLQADAPDIQQLLESVVSALGGWAVLVLDDFYYIPREDQAVVLAYLHQILKGCNIYLKVGGVRHRMRPYDEGDPPRGLLVPQDAAEVSLDLTLENYAAAKAFLEDVLEEICSEADIGLDDLLTYAARDRLVLASGGVARDYLFVVSHALEAASARVGSPQEPRNRITAEDVNRAAPRLREQKDQELALDAGADSQKLRDRFSELVVFCLDTNEVNIFLVEASDLQETAWGQEIEALAELRFVHRIRNLAIQDSAYRGRRFQAFALDLSSYSQSRLERITHILPDEYGRMRSPNLIYTPDLANQRSRERRPVAPESPATESVEEGQPRLFDGNS